MIATVFIIGLSLAMLVLLAGLFLLAYAKKEGLGKMTKIASYVAILFGTFIFVGGLLCAAMCKGKCCGNKCEKEKMECHEGNGGGHCESRDMECHEGMVESHCEKGDMKDCCKEGKMECKNSDKDCCKEDKGECKDAEKDCCKGETKVEKKVEVKVEEKTK